MAYENLKTAIKQAIKQNGNQEITGAILQNSLLSIINSIGIGSLYAGIAIPSTNPGTTDGNVFYLAGISGVYSNFGVTLQDEIAVIANTGNNSWVKRTVLGAATTKSAGVMSAEDKITLNLVYNNLPQCYYR